MNYFPEQVFVGLIEVPDEISLIIPFAGCGHTCKGCHSPEYQSKYNGVRLNAPTFFSLLEKYKDKVSCICFFGGEHEESLSWYIQKAKAAGFKTALYSGYEYGSIPEVVIESLDYLKTGCYDESLGGLLNVTTNQRLYQMNPFKDITDKFWQGGLTSST